MFDPEKYFKQGLNRTVKLQPGVNFSAQGDPIQVFGVTEIDRWYIGDYNSVEYKISIDYDYNAKETLQASVTASFPEDVAISVYGRTNSGNDLVDLIVSVNQSYVTISLVPKVINEISLNGAQAYFVATYFENNTLTTPRVEDSPISGAVAANINTLDANTISLDTNIVRWDRG